MTVFVLTLVVVGLVILGMAAGVLAGRPPIKGSCGGIGALGIDQSCEICGGDPKRCDEETRDGNSAEAANPLFYSADDAADDSSNRN